MDLSDIIVSLWDGLPNQGTFLGSGVCIAPDKVLTAKHVICPASGKEVPANRIKAGMVRRDPGMPIKSLHHYPDRDITLLNLIQPHNKTQAGCNSNVTLKQGMVVELLGYDNSPSGGDTKRFQSTLSIWAEPDSWKFHTQPSHGMSGGAVLWDGELVGIIQAKSDSQNAGIMIPLSAIHDFLAANLQLAPLPVPPEQDEQLELEDQQFLQDIHDSITANWKAFPPLSDVLAKTYKVLVGTALTDKLIEECGQGRFSKIIQHLQSAFVNCWRELGHTDILKRRDLLKVAESLVSHLALFNVRKDWLHAYLNHHASTGKPHHLLPKMRLESVHVAFSRQAKVVPSFREPSRKAESIKSLGNMFMLETGAGKDNSSVTLVLRALYAMFNPHSLETPDDNQDIAEEIREAILLYKTHEDVGFRQCPFVLVPQAEVEDVAYGELARLIPELEWVTLEAGGHQGVFVIRDVQLMTAIQQFFRTLEGYEPA